MINLDSILKSRDIILPAKVHLVKAMVFPVVMYGWRRKWQPTPVFLPRESHGQRSLGVYSPEGHKELDTTEDLTLSLFTFSVLEIREQLEND